MNRIQFDYSRKEPAAMAYLEETELIERFPKIPADPVLFGRCMTLMELMAAAWGEGDPAEVPYRFLLEYLRRANAGKMDADRHQLEAFRLLAILGHRPALDRCAACGNNLGRGWRYSVLEGGTVCAACAANRAQIESHKPFVLKVHTETVRTLEAGLTMSADKLGRLKFTGQGRKEAKELWIAHVRVLLGRTPRSVEYLEKIENGGSERQGDA